MAFIHNHYIDQQGGLLSDWSIHTLVPRFLAPRATESLINKHGCRSEGLYLPDHLFYSFVKSRQIVR